MQFSLLKWPTGLDVPNRIPLSRGVPNASAMAVDTGGMPRSLPLPEPVHLTAMSPDAVALPYQALARFAAAGGQVTSDMTNTVLAAEVKKREARTTTEIDEAYTSFTRAVDEDFEKQKVSESEDTLIPAFNQMWNTHMATTKGTLKSPEAQAGFQAKANSLLRAKSGEVTTTSTRKFVARQTAEFTQTVETLTDLATNPALTPAEQAVHQGFLESKFLQAAHSGLHSATDLQKIRREKLDEITLTRAKTKARFDPMGTLETMSSGDMMDVPAKHQATIIDLATNTLKVERAEREHNQALADKQKKQLQDEDTVELRQALVQNWSPDGPKTSMVNLINASARRVGDDNYKSLLETERIYQALATKPGPKKQSDTSVVGQLQAQLTSDRWREVTQADLLRLLKSEALDDGDHRYFSNKLDALHKDSLTAKPETEAQKVRKQQIVDAGKLVESFIQVTGSSKFENQPTDILQRDALTELHRQAAANPDMDPDDIATALIAKKISQYRALKDGLPYQRQEDVLRDYQAGLIPKREAERYIAILDLFEKTEPKKTTPAPAPASRFNPFGGAFNPFGGGESKPEGVRPPTKPKAH